MRFSFSTHSAHPKESAFSSTARCRRNKQNAQPPKGERLNFPRFAYLPKGRLGHDESSQAAPAIIGLSQALQTATLSTVPGRVWLALRLRPHLGNACLMLFHRCKAGYHRLSPDGGPHDGLPLATFTSQGVARLLIRCRTLDGSGLRRYESASDLSHNVVPDVPVCLDAHVRKTVFQ